MHPPVANGIVFIIYRGNSIGYDNVTRPREFYHKWKKLDKGQLLCALAYRMYKKVKLKGTESAWRMIEVIMAQRYEVSVRSKKSIDLSTAW